MISEDYNLKINQFEEIIQKLTADTTNNLIFENLSYSEIWKHYETTIISLQREAKELKEFMLIFKPEKAKTIEDKINLLLQTLSKFREILSQKAVDKIDYSNLSFEELRKVLVISSNLLDLAKEIKINPSKGISTIIRLKEVYDTKEYLSAIPIPEVAYAKFINLKKEIQILKQSSSNLEQDLKKFRELLNQVIEEISRFRPLSVEE
jgi:hypothetical protein